MTIFPITITNNAVIKNNIIWAIMDFRADTKSKANTTDNISVSTVYIAIDFT